MPPIFDNKVVFIAPSIQNNPLFPLQGLLNHLEKGGAHSVTDISPTTVLDYICSYDLSSDQTVCDQAKFVPIVTVISFINS